MKRLTLHAAVIVSVAAAAFATVAYSGPVEDGNAGLEAMDKGDYVTAARLFSAVIKAPDLADEDREFAYYNLGTIYLREGRYAQAVANLQRAVEIKADDTDAKTQLELAQAGKGGADALTVQWGGARLLDGGTWVAVEQHEDRKHKMQDDPQFYSAYSWSSRGQTLSFTGKDRIGSAVTGSFTRDAKTGVITGDSTSNGATTNAYLQPTLTGWIEYDNDNTVRLTVTPIDANSFQVVQEAYANNAWGGAKTYRLVQSPDLARKADKKFTTRKVTHCVGDALKRGLIAGLTGQDASTVQQGPECGGPQPQQDQQ